MFQGLESHSVLHVLHKSVKLALLPEREVLDLLRRRPVFSLTDDDQPFERQAAFFTEDDALSGDEDLGDASKIHPEVARDMILYHSFCAMRHFMASVTCMVEDPGKNRGENSGEGEQTGAGVDSFEQEPGNPSNVVQSSKCVELKDIRRLLEAGKKHLSHVYPLTYRVEVLENIFSLLFVTYEDLSDGRPHLNESDGMETNDDETRSLKSSLTGSLESLASTDLAPDSSLPFSPLKEQETGGGSPRMVTGDSPFRPRETAPPGEIPREIPRRRQLFRSDALPSDAVPEKERRAADGAGVSRKAKVSRTKPGFSSEVGSPRAPSRGGSEDERKDEPRVGFVASDSVVPEFLKALKDCLTELSKAKFSERRKGKFEPERLKMVAATTKPTRVGICTCLYLLSGRRGVISLAVLCKPCIGLHEGHTNT